MGWTRHSGAVVSWALLASVVANYAIHRHFENRHHQGTSADQSHADIPELPNFNASDFPPWDEPAPLGTVHLPEAPGRAQYRGDVVPAALASEATDPRPSTLPHQAADHSPVPVPSDSGAASEDETQPGHDDLTPGSNAVRNVIEDELSTSSREERDIWFQELKSLPAGVVRDLLQVRKQLRSLPKMMQGTDPISAVPSGTRVAEIPAEPASQSRRVTGPEWGPTLAALEHACAISRHNLANAATPGFKRFRVFLTDSYSPRDIDLPNEGALEPSNRVQVEGLRLSTTILDVVQGTLLQTERPLDLAIDGDGFFVAAVKDRTAYTRCGAMMLDSTRRICLAVSETPAVLQPVITIPSDAREIQISAQGQVSVLRKPGTDPEPVGQLQVARFANPARLRPIGDTLLVPTTESGPAEADQPDAGGRGVIQQGCLEQSNTELEAEQANLTQWQSLMKAIPVISHPVTARGNHPASR